MHLRTKHGHGQCRRHGPEYGACSCELGKLSRLIEPSIMLLLAEGKAFHGYELADRVNEMSVTDVPIERGAVYRTLRALEANGNVASRWDTSGGGPARRLYHLTASGREHLAEWMEVLQRRAENLMSMTGEYAQAKRKVARS